MKVINKEKFQKFLNEVLKESVNNDVDTWIDDVINQYDSTGLTSFEVNKSYTKSGNPECIGFEIEYSYDEDGEIEDTIIKF